MSHLKEYEIFLKRKIDKLNEMNPIYTLSGGIDSSLIFSYLDNPDCFCVQVDGNSDYEFAKRLNPNVIKIEFNDIDIEKLLVEVQALDGPHCGMSDFYDYFVYNQFPGRLIIVGEEPRYHNNINVSKNIRKLFFYYRYSKVDSPYMYFPELYAKEIIRELVSRRLPEFISNRPKKETGHNPVFKEKHEDQIAYLKAKYDIVEDNYNKMWKKLNLSIWRKHYES